MGVAAVRGMQGRKRPLGPDRVFCTLKHFIHGSPVGGLNIAPAEVNQRALRASYLVPFSAIVSSSEPAIIMPSYNEVLGVPSHANTELLEEIGRDFLGFRGVYFSDYGGIGNLMVQHHVAATVEDAAVLSMNAGIAVDLPDGESYLYLPELVRIGRISETQIDAAVSQVLALKFEAGLFEDPYVDSNRAIFESNRPDHVEIARIAAEKSIVMLKNDGILPLQCEVGMKLAVIGPNSKEPLFGGYSGSNASAVGILQGIQNKAPNGIHIEYAEGVWITSPNANGEHFTYDTIDYPSQEGNLKRIAQAVEVAKGSDVILLVIGDVPSITREAVHVSMPGDRSTLDLWGMQDELVEAMIATGKPIITLLINGRPLSVNRVAEKSNGLFEGWYLGQDGGNAFANVLFGDVNPGGKLTVSIPRSVGELPVYYNRQPSADVNTYIEGQRQALFSFGYGLSYASFDISAPRLSKSHISANESVEVEVDVTNTSERIGDEVIQLYLQDEVSSVPRPILELKGFQRITLSPKETKTVRFQIGPDVLAFWDINRNWVVEPGTFKISVGNSSIDLKSITLEVISSK